MDKSQSLALFAKGKDAWNKWAKGMLAEKKRLQKLGKWGAEKEKWDEEAKADFSWHTFPDHEGPANFSEFIFPGFSDFQSSQFEHLCNFTKSIFFENARFNVTKFNGPVEFIKARFLANVDFFATQFLNDAWLQNASFFGNAMFSRAVFSASTFFEEATFYFATGFDLTEFLGETRFYKSNFFNQAVFASTTFKGDAYFGSAKFIADPRTPNADPHTAFFTAIVCERYFNLDGARFEQVPNFSQAHFLEAPSLDRIVIGSEARENPTPPASRSPSPLRGEIKGGGSSSQKELEQIPARWRHLRRLATQGHDHENEQKFFAEEIRSRRKVFDFLLGKNWQRYWAGQVYQKLSDFGRSIWRPIWIWIGTTLAYAATLFLAHNYISTLSPPLGRDGCMLGSSDPITTALKVAIDNAPILPVFGVSDGRAQEYLCLFGHDISLKTPVLPPVPLVPWWISGLGTFHTVFSAILIFLILLAIRNQFRIR